jgi:hypothetical protein
MHEDRTLNDGPGPRRGRPASDPPRPRPGDHAPPLERPEPPPMEAQWLSVVRGRSRWPAGPPEEPAGEA